MQQQFHQARIMIVDDTPANLNLLMEILLKKGHQIVAFPSGQQALEAASKTPPDLILLDIRMPGMDGFEVCRKLKQDPDLQDIPVIFISALQDVSDKVQAYNTGGVDYVSKPFQPEEVYARVETHLRLNRLLRESEESRRVLIEELPDIIVRFDRQARHVSVSDNIRDLGITEPGEYIGRTHRELGYSESCCRFWEKSIATVFDSGEPLEEEMSLYSGENEGLIHNVRMVPERDSSGNIVTVLAISRDITLQKQAQQALLNAKKDAEAANQAKNEFLANMSHEIRTPLNGIDGVMQMLLSTSLTAEQKKFLEMGMQASKRLTELLSDILDLSRLEAGRNDIQENLFSLRDICDVLTELFAITSRDKGVSIDFNLSPLLPSKVLGDATRVRQVLYNLLGNSIKFTSQGTVSLDISPVNSPEQGKKNLLFTVSDTGEGIPKDKLETILQPFTMANGSSTRRHQGAGLGLSVTHRLVELMGGSISIESTQGQGTSVYVTLPFKTHEEAGYYEQGHKLNVGQDSTGLKILVADDDSLTRLFFQKVLEGEGHQVVAVEDGDRVMSELAMGEFDCILMDIEMPGTTGDMVTNSIRSTDGLGSKKNIPIIAVTAHTGPGDREYFLKKGMDDYLPKPVGIQDFKLMLKKHGLMQS